MSARDLEAELRQAREALAIAEVARAAADSRARQTRRDLLAERVIHAHPALEDLRDLWDVEDEDAMAGFVEKLVRVTG